MNVAAEIVRRAQFTGDANHLFHCVIGRADNAGGEKETLDVIATVEFKRQPDDFVDRKACPLDIARGAIDAIRTVVDAEVRHQDFKERNTSPIWCIGVADSGALS